MSSSFVLLVDQQDWDIIPSLQRLEQLSTASRQLQRALRESTDLIQTELAALSPIEIRAFGCQNDPQSKSLVDLAKACGESDAAHSVLACVCCLGEIIVTSETQRCLPSTKSYVFDLGPSALMAAAASAATDADELCELGVEAIAVALRLSIELRLRSLRVEETAQSWARTVHGVSAESVTSILDSYNQGMGILPHQKVYISEQSPEWVTVSGPPSHLSNLLRVSSDLQGAASLSGSAHSALHAPHLPSLNVREIVGKSRLLRRPLLSAVHDATSPDWSPYRASDLADLLRQMCQKIGHEPISVPKVPDDAMTSIATSATCTMLVLGSDSRTTHIRQMLANSGCKSEPLGDPGTPSVPRGLREGSGSIAVVGMAGRFPGNNDVAGFWESLIAGDDFHKKVPEDRYDLEAWKHTVRDNSPLPYGCFLEQPGLFDHHLFNISPREALQMDPNQRLLLTASYEALQRAGYSRNGTLSTESSRVATFVGQTTDDWRDVTASHGIDIYYVPGVLRSFAPGRLNYHYKWEGPSYSIDSTCASSASAIGLACTALLARDCDMALAGGVNSLASPAMFAGLKAGGFLSPTGACKTFRDDADGYCRAEGVGVVVLKRVEDAVLDNDNILAVIKSHARNHSAHASSITHPDVGAQSRLYDKALRKAGMQPNQISYVEMHGTGTQAGDVTEVQAVVDTFCKGREEHNPILVGAVKANVGHAEAAAGVLSMIKSIMILKTGKVPCQPGMPFKVNPRLALSGRLDIRIADGSMPLKRQTRDYDTRRLVLNNFDASGGNVCFVMEEAPQREPKTRDSRSHSVVAVSARTISSLKKSINKLSEHLISLPDAHLQHVSYTTTARSMHERLRVAYVAENKHDLLRQLRAETLDSLPEKLFTSPPNVGILCTGMSAQYAGMGADLYRTNSRFHDSICSMEKVCLSQNLPTFVGLIADSTTNVSSYTTTQIQLALVAVEIALADLWSSWGIRPSFVIGHSLGEYAALCIAGVLSVSDALSLVGIRASLMEEHLDQGTYSMLAVAAPSTSVVARLTDSSADGCTVSCFNAPCSTVVSGSVEAIQQLQQTLRNAGTRSTLLRVAHGFHSSQFDPILAAFAARARSVQFFKPRIPVVSSLLGRIVRDKGTFDADYLVRQTRQPVRFVDALNACTAEGLADARTVWLEVGPEQVCLEFVKATLQGQNLCPTIRAREANWKTIASSAAAMYKRSLPVVWGEYHKEYAGCLSLLELPTYSFDETNFWAPYRYHTPSTVDNSPLAITKRMPGLSPSLHSVLQETITDTHKIFTFRSDLADSDLHAAIFGHIIDGTALCPGSVFCDIAFTAAGYIHSRVQSGRKPVIELRNMILERAIVVPQSTSNNTILVTSSMSSGAENYLDVAFKHDSDSHCEATGHCQVILGDLGRCQQESSSSSFFVKARMHSVIAAVTSGSGHRLHKSIVYKIFSTVVSYSKPYQAIDELFWDEPSGEAVAAITFQEYPGSDGAHHSPYWLDVMLHLPGFMLNANITTVGHTVYICDGFRSMRLVDALATRKRYHCYVRKQDNQKTLSVSDAYLFDGEDLVGVCLGIRFKQIPRSKLSHVLRQPSDASRIDGVGPISSIQGEATSFPARDPFETDIQRPPKVTLSRSRTHTSGTKVENGRTIADLLIKVVSEETRVPLHDMQDATEFTELGVDSLLAIAIVDRVRKLTGLELGANFFTENSTVSDAKAVLGHPAIPSIVSRATSTVSSGSTASLRDDSRYTISTNTPEATPVLLPSDLASEGASALHTLEGVEYTASRASNAVLIHGDIARYRKPLFLITDGAGSATAYLQLPRFPSNLPTYALESPFLRCPQQYSASVEEIATMYIATVRSIQPCGPYMIGGWSAGGVHAYEVCRQLLEMGDAVQCLVILDMHVPRPMPPGHEVTPSFIEKIGVATGINRMAGNTDPAAVRSLKEHLLHTVRSLSVYKPRSMSRSRRPAKTMIIWARRSLSEILGGEDMESAANAGLVSDAGGNVMQDPEMDLCAWFFSRRHHFGANGWDSLVGGDVVCHDVDGDHFSMMTAPTIYEVARFMDQAISL